MTDIVAKAALSKGVLTASLTIGNTSLTLVGPKDEIQTDGVTLVEQAEAAFVQVLEALVEKAEGQHG